MCSRGSRDLFWCGGLGVPQAAAAAEREAGPEAEEGGMGDAIGNPDREDTRQAGRY